MSRTVYATIEVERGTEEEPVTVLVEVEAEVSESAATGPAYDHGGIPGDYEIEITRTVEEGTNDPVELTYDEVDMAYDAIAAEDAKYG